MNLSMFKAYDIRTKHSKLNDKMISRLAEAIALYYKEDVAVKSIIIARDARLYCPELMESIYKSCLRIGLDVYMNPIQTSTCQFYFMCMQKPESGGIMITASHNPGEYVGCKFVGPNATAIASGCGIAGGIDKIKKNYIENRTYESAPEKGKIHIYQSQKEFVEYSMKLAGVKPGDLKGMKIFGEFFSGSSGTDFAMAFDIAGADLTLNHIVPDGFFPGGDPNPVVEKSMEPARALMKKGQYDVGFAFDGDGDRMDLMFPDGEQIIPGLNMSILIEYIRDIFIPYFGKDYQYRFFSDVKATPIVVSRIAKTGVEPHIIRNGHSFIKDKLREYRNEGYIASEEESAHYYMNFPYDPEDLSKGFAAIENTLFFALLSARAIKEHPEKYDEIKKLQKNINRYREWPLNFDVPELMPQIMQDVEDAMVAKGAVVIKEMDDGSDLDATLFKFNLPERFDKNTEFPEIWCQVAQRISRSEDAMTRWEVVASDKKLCDDTNAIIRAITDDYVKKGYAHY